MSPDHPRKFHRERWEITAGKLLVLNELESDLQKVILSRPKADSETISGSAGKQPGPCEEVRPHSATNEAAPWEKFTTCSRNFPAVWGQTAPRGADPCPCRLCATDSRPGSLSAASLASMSAQELGNASAAILAALLSRAISGEDLAAKVAEHGLVNCAISARNFSEAGDGSPAKSAPFSVQLVTIQSPSFPSKPLEVIESESVT